MIRRRCGRIFGSYPSTAPSRSAEARHYPDLDFNTTRVFLKLDPMLCTAELAGPKESTFTLPAIAFLRLGLEDQYQTPLPWHRDFRQVLALVLHRICHRAAQALRPARPLAKQNQASGHPSPWLAFVFRFWSCVWTKSISHHLGNPGMNDSPLNTNEQWLPMVSKWCQISSIHSRV